MSSEKNSSSHPDVDRTPVAKDIWCYSTKEKAFTWHVVVNHDANGYVDKVLCKVSGVTHKYKREKKAASATKKKVVRRTANIAKQAETSATLEQEWFEGVKNWGDNVVSEFDPKKCLEEGDVFTHKVFGKGVVKNKRDNKVDVMFRSSIKVLPTAKSPRS